MADEPFQILNVQFDGIESMDPPVFDPNVKTYHVTRNKRDPCSIAFSVTGNNPSSNIYYRYKLEYTYGSGVNSWMPNNGGERRSHAVTLPNCKISLRINIGPQSAYKETIPWVCYSFEFDRVELTPEEEANCPHTSTYTREGEIWGGASGSSQVEILHTCCLCMKVLDRSFEYYD